MPRDHSRERKFSEKILTQMYTDVTSIFFDNFSSGPYKIQKLFEAIYIFSVVTDTEL